MDPAAVDLTAVTDPLLASMSEISPISAVAGVASPLRLLRAVRMLALDTTTFAPLSTYALLTAPRNGVPSSGGVWKPSVPIERTLDGALGARGRESAICAKGLRV